MDSADNTVVEWQRSAMQIAGQIKTQAKAAAGTVKPAAAAFGAAVKHQAITAFHAIALNPEDDISFFEPKTWHFWRGVILAIFFISIIGHWMEIPYCFAMDALFGIVEDDYAVWLDPFYVPYWVYGVSAAVLALTLLPLKIKLLGRRKTVWGAMLEFLVIAVFLCAALECIIGWIINQPDQFGEYPYWDNSQLPLNIFGQAWLVNDVFLALVSLVYVWFIFPFCQKVLKLVGEKVANAYFAGCIAMCAFIVMLSYLPLIQI